MRAEELWKHWHKTYDSLGFIETKNLAVLLSKVNNTVFQVEGAHVKDSIPLAAHLINLPSTNNKHY